MRVPWTARSNPSVLKEVNPDYSFEGLMLKLKLWSPDAKRQLIRKDPMLGKIEGKRRKGWQRMRRLDSITDSMDMNLRKFQEIVKHGELVAVVHRVSKSWT